MNSIPVSVALCVYKNDDLGAFKEAVNSILNQSCLPNEILIVVDGDVSDEHNDYLSELENGKIVRIYRLVKNKGHAMARQKGLELAVNEIVALMDADDISDKNRLERQYEFLLSNPDVDVVGSQIIEFDSVTLKEVGVRKVPLHHSEIYRQVKLNCPMNQVTVMFRKNSALEAGGYLDWFHNEDYYLWARMLLKGCRFANLNENLVRVRVNDAMYQRRGGWKYFVSEAKLQFFLYEKNLISAPQLVRNIALRFGVQIVLPNKLRRLIFIKIFRTKSQ